jgi:hypothetical protein
MFYGIHQFLNASMKTVATINTYGAVGGVVVYTKQCSVGELVLWLCNAR